MTIGRLNIERTRAFVRVPFRFRIEYGEDIITIDLWIGLRLIIVTWDRS